MVKQKWTAFIVTARLTADRWDLWSMFYSREAKSPAAEMFKFCVYYRVIITHSVTSRRCTV